MAAMTDTQYYFLCFILSFISIFLLKPFFKKPSKTKTSLHLPPSPPALPIIGHLHYLGPSLYKSLTKLSTKYGPLLYLKLGVSRCLVVSSASVANEIFKTHDLAFAERPSFPFSDKLPYGSSGFFVAPYGDQWRFIKKLCMTELLSAKQVEKSRVARHEELVRFLLKVLESAKKKQTLDMSVEIMKLTNNSTFRLAMSMRSLDEPHEAERIRKLVKESNEVGAKACLGDMFGPLSKLAFWLYGQRAIDVTLKYDEILERFLKQHEEISNERENEDLMDLLLKAYRDDKSEFKINRIHLKAFLLDLFLAGVGTSAEVTLWTLAELINNPDVFNKVREEIKYEVGNTRLVEESDVPSLPYLQAVIKEALRLHPALPVVVRECREDCKIKDFDVPKKTMVAVNLYAIMRDEKIWDYPNDFRPERFLVSSKGKDGMEHIPFGAGRRGCPGEKLAFSMIQILVAAMVQCFDWKVGREGDNVKVNMQVGPGITKPMAKPLICLPIVHFNPFTSSI
ncbi:cytochrome P450 705A20-like [Castanea sativa]|uniref:cytochrome P450 705A20-like n=1 Tax=Castanea sativa TaxID=21020 RepID=UPI003F64A671